MNWSLKTKFVIELTVSIRCMNLNRRRLQYRLIVANNSMNKTGEWITMYSLFQCQRTTIDDCKEDAKRKRELARIQTAASCPLRAKRVER